MNQEGFDYQTLILWLDIPEFHSDFLIIAMKHKLWTQHKQLENEPKLNASSSRTPGKNRSSNWSPGSSTALLAPLQPPNHVNRSKPIFSTTRKLNNPNADLDSGLGSTYTQIRSESGLQTGFSGLRILCYPKSDILIQTTDIEEHKMEQAQKRKTPLKKTNIRKPKSGPKITPKPTRRLEPESQEVLEDLEPKDNPKDPDFNPKEAPEDTKAKTPKNSIRRSRRSATRASSKSAGVRPFTPRVQIGDTAEPAEQCEPVVSNKRKIPAKTESTNVSSRNWFFTKSLFLPVSYVRMSSTCSHLNSQWNIVKRKLQKRSVSPYDCSDEDEIHCRIELRFVFYSLIWHHINIISVKKNQVKRQFLKLQKQVTK